MKDFADYFEIIKFATPETNVRLKNANNVPKNEEIIVKKCMNWEDVMHLEVADTILTRNDIKVRWFVPYKPFARQDRTTALTHGNESDRLANILWEQDSRLIFLDVHSNNHHLGHHIHQFAPIKKYDPFAKSEYSSWGDWHPRFHLIVPDQGARIKIPRNYSGGVTYCSKKRDPVTGKLSGFEVPEVKARRKEPLVLVDDICDGGGTFIGIAEHLQKYREKVKLILYVTHGLFTKGVDELLKYFDEIVTTNSVFVSTNQNSQVKVIDVLSDEFVEYGLKENI